MGHRFYCPEQRAREIFLSFPDRRKRSEKGQLQLEEEEEEEEEEKVYNALCWWGISHARLPDANSRLRKERRGFSLTCSFNRTYVRKEARGLHQRFHSTH